MKKPLIVIATHNRDKLREIRRILNQGFLTVRGLDDFPPPYTVRETGKTLEDNALLKARKAVQRTGQMALSDDSGLEVAALGGRPGVYSARFAGSGCSYADNNRKILRLLKGKKRSQRRALFRCVVALVTPEGKERLFQGRCPGWIVEEVHGQEGFGYDPIFEPKGEGCTFAELSLARKNEISHRALAFQRAAAYLKSSFRQSPKRTVR
ncbi:MAG: RdgB/HAM1 family non-canonical purine NTP pyrophosphatase [Elusimicrobia bacterium]|jgi:XTP/dITP diphosphohydrolase|nr:RdgB/HAM1 family non-canonical purine NTP pyrophosphatase [Elusimicrobiota bacterium]